MRTIHDQLQSSQKPSRGVSYYSAWVNRPLGRLFAVVAIRVGIGPNAVTALSALVTAVGLGLIAVMGPTTPVGLTVTFLLVAGFALDSADGQVARYTGQGSPAGEWLDHVVDAAKMVAIHAVVLINWYRFQGQSGSELLIPLGYQLVAVTMFAGGTLADLLLRAKRSASAAPSVARDSSRVRAIALIPADYGLLALTFVTFGHSAVHRWIYSALLVLNAVLLGALLLRWFRLLRDEG